MFCTMSSLAVSSALWMTATSANPIGIQIVRDFGVQIGFGKWLMVACVPALTAILALTTAIRPHPWYDPRYAVPLAGIVLGPTDPNG